MFGFNHLRVQLQPCTLGSKAMGIFQGGTVIRPNRPSVENQTQKQSVAQGQWCFNEPRRYTSPFLIEQYHLSICVIPTKASIQDGLRRGTWIPAFAGMTHRYWSYRQPITLGLEILSVL